MFLGQTAVMRCHVGLAATLGEMAGHALGQSAGVDEDDGRAVGSDEFREPVVDFDPDLIGHDRLQRRARHLQPQVPSPDVALVDDRTGRTPGAHQKVRHRLHGLRGRRDADPRRRTFTERLETLQRQRQMRTALVSRDRMELIHDDGLHRAQHPAPRLGRQQDVERLRRRHQNVGRAPAHPRPLALRGIPRTHHGTDRRVGQSVRLQRVPDSVSGTCRFFWMSFDRAFRGET